MIEHLELLVEEQSTEEALRTLLSRFLNDVTFSVYAYNGKHDLLAKLPSRLRGYAAWLPANWRIIVVVDRDDGDCNVLKQQLEKMASDASIATRSASSTGHVLTNRITIEELEAWYFGDWDAVRAVYPKVSVTIPTKARYRDPDAISGGTWEAFEQVLQTAGYMENGLRKIESARAIAAHMQPERNTSRSFQVFWRAITDR